MIQYVVSLRLAEPRVSVAKKIRPAWLPRKAADFLRVANSMDVVGPMATNV